MTKLEKQMVTWPEKDDSILKSSDVTISINSAKRRGPQGDSRPSDERDEIVIFTGPRLVVRSWIGDTADSFRLSVRSQLNGRDVPHETAMRIALQFARGLKVLRWYFSSTGKEFSFWATM